MPDQAEKRVARERWERDQDPFRGFHCGRLVQEDPNNIVKKSGAPSERGGAGVTRPTLMELATSLY